MLNIKFKKANLRKFRQNLTEIKDSRFDKKVQNFINTTKIKETLPSKIEIVYKLKDAV